ncbi:MAG TPA: hypothetical protein VIC28_00760 [Thermoanaerobaculia bacterium]
MASSLAGRTPMLSQCPGRTPAARQAVAAAADEAEDAVQDLLRGAAIGTIGGGDGFQTVNQAVEVPPMGDLPDEAAAARASPQEVAHDLPVLSPGELRPEEALDDLVREVLIRHVIPPGNHKTFNK